MKPRRPSRTAEHNAFFRAIDCAALPEVRIVNDPLAFHFLDGSLRLTARLCRNPICSAALCRYIDHRWPGSRTSLIARTRLIDDHLATALARPFSQVVVLGAGFDSRAYRIAGAERATFFEVDHPNTSAAKRARLGRLLGTLPEHVKYVELNFQRDSLTQALEAAGFDPFLPSCVLWEGVSNYLTAESVEATLAFISNLVAGTQLIFTYVDESVLRDPAAFAGGVEVQRTITKLKEPWTFGIRPSNAANFFGERGLTLDSDVSAAEYRRLYYGNDTRISGYEFYHVVTAHVPGKISHPTS
jgi:methyltransferase (TIGR00027 family)